MSIEAELRAILTGDGAVTALVGTRVYPLEVPQDGTLPAIVYQELRTGVRVASDGPTGQRETRFLLSLWSESYSGLKTLQAAVLDALSGYAGGNIYGVEVDAMRDDFDPAVRWFREIMEILVWYHD